MRPSDLQIGRYYYRLTFADAELSEPGLEPVVYVGQNILAEEREKEGAKYYFQDTVSVARFGLIHDVEPANSEECLVMSESGESVPTSIVSLEEAVIIFQKILSGNEAFKR